MVCNHWIVECDCIIDSCQLKFNLKIMDLDETKINCLLSEYTSVTDHIYNLQIAQYTIGGALVIIFTSVFLSKLRKNHEIKVFLPFAIVLIYLAQLINFNEIRALGGYKMFLGEQINEMLGQKVFTWEILVSLYSNNTLYITSISGIMFFCLMLFAMVNSIISVKQVAKKNSFLNKKVVFQKLIVSRVLLGIIFVILIIFVIHNIFESQSLKECYYESALKLSK